MYETHGMTDTPEYRAWKNMRNRCSRRSNPDYKNYGARGICVCHDWDKSFTAFFVDMGKCPPGYQLDRINNNGNYKPGNCRWTTKQINNLNRRIDCKNKSGIKGVSWKAQYNKWQATIYKDGKQKHLGYFENIQCAAQARAVVEREYCKCSEGN